jgi:hypothetical protein
VVLSHRTVRSRDSCLASIAVYLEHRVAGGERRIVVLHVD